MKLSMKQFLIRGTGEVSALDKKVVHFIACNNSPFTIVESNEFKVLLPSGDQENLKGRKHYSEWALPRIYSAVKKAVMSRLVDCMALSFTSDIWSGPMESFISLTAHGIDSSWKRQKFVLCVRHFPGSHNFETIGEIVGKMLTEWGIEQLKRHVFVRDEGSNMKKAFEEGGHLHADCGAHKLNLVVTNSLFKNAETKSMLESCRKLVGHFSHSTLAKDRLKDEQKSVGLKEHRILQDEPTRWNSSFYMGSRLLEQRTAIDLYLTRHNKRNLELTREEWSLLERVVKILDPLESASKQMCREDEPISVQFPIARALTADMYAIDDPGLQQLRVPTIVLKVFYATNVWASFWIFRSKIEN